jgi:hypothetical protein
MCLLLHCGLIAFGVGGCVGALHVTSDVFGLVYCCLPVAGGGCALLLAWSGCWLFVELGVVGLVCAPLCHHGVLAGAMVHHVCAPLCHHGVFAVAMMVVCQCTGLCV